MQPHSMFTYGGILSDQQSPPRRLPPIENSQQSGTFLPGGQESNGVPRKSANQSGELPAVGQPNEPAVMFVERMPQSSQVTEFKGDDSSTTSSTDPQVQTTGVKSKSALGLRRVESDQVDSATAKETSHPSPLTTTTTTTAVTAYPTTALPSEVEITSPVNPPPPVAAVMEEEEVGAMSQGGQLDDPFGNPSSPTVRVRPKLVPRSGAFQLGENLSLCLITWNMEGTSGPESLSSFITPGTHDIFAVGTEECERSIAASAFNNSKGKWVEKLVVALGDGYVTVASHTLMSIHIIIFAKKEIMPYFKEVQTQEVATGFLNGTVGNKGGVCVSCMIGTTSVLFVNAHFAASQNGVSERNSNYKKIVSETTLRSSKWTASSSRSLSPAKPTRASTRDNESKPTNESGIVSSPTNATTTTTEVTTASQPTPPRPVSPSPSPPPQHLYITPITTTTTTASATTTVAATEPSANVGEMSTESVSSALAPTITTTTTTTTTATAPPPPPPSSSSSKPVNDATNCFDVIFWMGDLNYRIDGSRRMVDVILKDESYREVLLNNDQLLKAIRKGDVFHGFKEGPISFNPTYKYHKENGRATEVYDLSEKTRIPAWTDRILFKTNPPFVEQDVALQTYTTLNCSSLWVSDHRPVTAHFLLKTPAPVSPPTPPSLKPTAGSKACIIS